MFGLHTKSVHTAAASSRPMRPRTRLDLEALEPRDVPSSIAAPVLAASVIHHFPPNPIMPNAALVSLSAVHHYPPNPI
jgi:hypothetical protein